MRKTVALNLYRPTEIPIRHFSALQVRKIIKYEAYRSAILAGDLDEQDGRSISLHTFYIILCKSVKKNQN